MTSNRFQLLGKLIVNNIQENLSLVYNEFSLIVGGGLGYESIKYNDNNLDGDIDLVLFISDIEYIERINNLEYFVNNLNFSVSSVKKIPKKDIQEFIDGNISVLRISGAIQNIKTSLSITTYGVAETYKDLNRHPLYKTAHSNTYTIINAISPQGSETLVAMISPEIWGKYCTSPKKINDYSHYKILDNNWYFAGKTFYVGLITDCIAKGVLVYDYNQRVEIIQNQLLGYLAHNASPEIKNSKSWHGMFASNTYFGEQFKQKLNKKISDINSKTFETTAITNQEEDSIAPICVFDKDDQYKINPKDYLSEFNKLFTNSKNNKSLDFWLNEHEI
jgi:hypothetical protein